MRQKVSYIVSVALACTTASPLSAQTAEQFARTQAAEIASRRYDVYQVSSGSNRPALNLNVDRGATLMVMLREGLPVTTIAEALGWTDTKTRERVQALLDVGFIARDGDRYRPRVAVLTADVVARYMPLRDEAVTAAARLIADSLSFIRRQYGRIPGFRHVRFEDASLLVLSDVLLDNWQLRTVERDFVGAARPTRAGGQYYLFVEEHTPWVVGEPFDLYGNTGSGVGNINIGLYGKGRGRDDINSTSAESLRIRFGANRADSSTNLSSIAIAIAAAVRDSGAAVPSALRQGLESFRLVRDGRLIVPVLHSADNLALDSLAASMAPGLLAVLRGEKPWLLGVYAQSPFARETSFEEYLTFWYHVFYSAVTDRLVAAGIITLPPSGATTYLVVY